MEYTICSSSEEEGEISLSTVFPTHISVLTYCYYPKTLFFIGDNYIPRLSDFQDFTLTTRIKKKLKKDIFDTMNLFKDKAFFDNKFCKVASLTIPKNCTEASLYDIISDYREINEFYLLKKGSDLYLELFNKIVYQQNKENIILIKDSLLTKIHNKNVFVFFKILKNNNILFEDSYHRIIDVYEYLEIYFEEICKEYKSTEERWYKYKNYDLIIYSSTCFKTKKNRDEILMRYYNGIDCSKNYLAVCNKKSICIKKISFVNQVNLGFLDSIINLKLEDGDYACNNGVIYKIGINGEHINYEGIDYTLIN